MPSTGRSTKLDHHQRRDVVSKPHARPSRVTVRVWAADIVAALRDACLDRAPAQYCPVAWALCRALGVPLGSVTVGPSNVDCEAWQEHGPVEGLLPPHVTRALDQFDRTRTTRPFTFQVPLQLWAGGVLVRPHAFMATSSVWPNPLV
jgi:hypothetical protein